MDVSQPEVRRDQSAARGGLAASGQPLWQVAVHWSTGIDAQPVASGLRDRWW